MEKNIRVILTTLNNLAYLNSYLGMQTLALEQFNEVVSITKGNFG
jgi:hypothetical protein